MSLEQITNIIMMICSLIGIVLSLIFIYSFFRISKLHKSPGDIYFGMCIGELIYEFHYLSESCIFLELTTFSELEQYYKSDWCKFNLFAFTLAVIVIYSYTIQLYMHMIIRLIFTLQAKKIAKWQGHLITWIIASLYSVISVTAYDQSICGVTLSSSAPFTFIILLISFLVMAITTRIYIKQEFSQHQNTKLQKQGQAFVSYLTRLFQAQATIMSSFVIFIMLAYIIEISEPKTIKSTGAIIFALLAQLSAYFFPIVIPIVRSTDPYIFKHLRKFYFREKQSLSESNISMVEQTLDSQCSDFIQLPKISIDELTQSLIDQNTLKQEEEQSKKKYSHSSFENFRSNTANSMGRIRKPTIKQEDPFIHQLTNQLRSEIIKRIMSMILVQEADKIKKFKTSNNFKRSLRSAGDGDYSEQLVYNVNQLFLQEQYPNQFAPLDKKFKMIAYAPAIFHILIKEDQEKLNIDNCLNLESNSQQIMECAQTTGGKSGEFFFFNYNNKLLLKTISVMELQTLIEMIEQYFWHCTNNPNTLLAKILGIFTFENFEIGRISMILMKNIGKINKAAFNKIYDLKGSSYDRQVIKQRKQSENNLQQDISESSSKVLKDMDFLKIEKQLNLVPPHNVNIYEQMEIDTLFLKQLGFMDYSLCIIVVDWLKFYKTTLQQDSQDEEVIKKIMFQKLNKLQHCYPNILQEGVYYHIGIIDYLQKYNLQKITEKYAKKFMKLDSNLDTSSQNPYEYRKRFLMFLKKIL